MISSVPMNLLDGKRSQICIACHLSIDDNLPDLGHTEPSNLLNTPLLAPRAYNCQWVGG